MNRGGALLFCFVGFVRFPLFQRSVLASFAVTVDQIVVAYYAERGELVGPEG